VAYPRLSCGGTHRHWINPDRRSSTPRVAPVVPAPSSALPSPDDRQRVAAEPARSLRSCNRAAPSLPAAFFLRYRCCFVVPEAPGDAA